MQVYGVTRGGKSADKLRAQGATPVIGNYTVKSDLEAAFRNSGAKLLFLITDFFLAAKGNKDVEIQQGNMAIDVAKAVGVEFIVFVSVADCDVAPDNVEHLKSKHEVEIYLIKSGLKYGILRPVAFFENLDDPVNYNPLVKGSVKMLTGATLKWVSCTDIGKASAALFSDPVKYHGKIIPCASWQGTGEDLAVALTRASGIPSTFSVGVPRWAQYLFMRDLYNMISYFEAVPGLSEAVSIDEFKAVVPDAMTAEEWFRAKGKWSNGESFGASSPEDTCTCSIS